jgi:hypothetical protein
MNMNHAAVVFGLVAGIFIGYEFSGTLVCYQPYRWLADQVFSQAGRT